MNGTPDNIVVNSCELTPIYLIQDSGVAQATSYVLTPANQVEQKPVSNLKRFYESSGNLEKSVLLNSPEPPAAKPRILKKVEPGQIGNNLKLASFLVPKSSAHNVQTKPIHPMNTANTLNTINTMNSINSVNTINTVNSKNAVNSINSVNSINTAKSINTVNSINSVNSINTVKSINKVNSINTVNSINAVNPINTVNSVNNIVFKPATATLAAASQNVPLTMTHAVPKLDMDRKIVKLKPSDTASRHFRGRSVPKIKPKEVIPELPKYTSVQLLKLGETYHSNAHGFIGNENADELARRGSMNNYLGPEPFVGLSKGTTITAIKDHTKHKHQQEWGSLAGLRHSKLFMHKVDSSWSKKLWKLSRRRLQIITGVFTGHYAVKGVLARMGLSDNTDCRMCGEEEETMEHLMCECHALARQRMKDFGTGYPDPEEFKALPLSSIIQHMEMVEKALDLNVLSDDQVKMVNQALNIIKDPEKIPQEPAYDPITNTRFIYKVVSPKDLRVVGRNKVALKEPRRLAAALDARPAETVVTRSGRKVRLPRQVVHEEPPKPRRRPGSVVSCAQCCTDFGSIYQLQKHYESQPTHAPSKTHWSLFHCLLAIVAGSPAEVRAKLFIQQLELLMRKLRALLPCLLAGAGAGAARQPQTDIGDDVSRLLGLSSGKYNLDMDALSCVKDTEGRCQHDAAVPAPAATASTNTAAATNTATNTTTNTDTNTAACTRVLAWPAGSPRAPKPRTNRNLKKMRLAPHGDVIQLDREPTDVPVPQKMISLLKNEIQTETRLDKPQLDEIKKPQGHMQFHSAHFDIRSSPIKPSSTVFRTFQINPDKMEKLNVQIMRPLELDRKSEEVVKEPPTTSDCTKLDSIFRDEIELVSCKDVINNELDNGLNFSNSKDWAIPSTNDDQSHEIFLKQNAVIEPSLMHVKDDAMGGLPVPDGGLAVPDGSLTYSDINQNADMPVLTDEHDTQDSRLNLSQNQSVLNFLETLGNELTYPEPEIRNAAVDFHLDLFSFNNT